MHAIDFLQVWRVSLVDPHSLKELPSLKRKHYLPFLTPFRVFLEVAFRFSTSFCYLAPVLFGGRRGQLTLYIWLVKHASLGEIVSLGEDYGAEVLFT